ncbi:glycosyltransferase [Enterococcus faecium]|uniref:glycosyltransferase n=1 Tax=Enterococcus faecium TaxID=1352 RepID=UPI003CC6405D
MRILFISDNTIKGFGGGSIENRKHYDALREYCINNGHELKVISIDGDLKESMNVKIRKNKFIDILVRLKGHSTYLYDTWKQNEVHVCAYRPDILYLGRSRFGFVAKRIKKVLPECRVITNIDNVEVDYVDGYFSLKKGIINKLYKLLEILAVKRDESQAIKYSDLLIYLTQRNVLRVEKIYNHHEDTPIILPICLKEEIELKKNQDSRTVVFVGSLDYGANVLAVKWILELWKKLYASNQNIELIIAGRNPSNELSDVIRKMNNVTLIQNFDSLSDFIPRNSLMLAPIEKGAGMKVKVAETLSMGLMIAASDEALVGYEDAELQDKVGGIVRANTEEEYKKSIADFLCKTDEELNEISRSNKDIYKKFYSYETSRSIVSEVCNTIFCSEKEIKE